jgi:hypothetical protein
MLKKKMWANCQRIIEFFTQKIVTKLSYIWVWDPGSGKNLFRIPNPGVKKAPDPGSGSATLPISLDLDLDPVNLEFYVNMLIELPFLRPARYKNVCRVCYYKCRVVDPDSIDQLLICHPGSGFIRSELRIRIRTRSLLCINDLNQCCGSESGFVGSVFFGGLLDPDPDP